MRHVFLLLSIFIAGFNSFSQGLPSLASPGQSVRTHLDYLQDEKYNDSIASTPFISTKVSPSEALIAAIRWKQVLDGKGIYVETDEIPINPNHFDSVSHRYRYVVTSEFPNVYLEKSGNKWIYPPSSVHAINQAHEQLFRFGTDRLLTLLPKIGTRKILGLYLWQYVAILMLISIAVIVQRLFSLFFNRLFLRIVKKAGYEHLADGYLIPIAKPAGVFVVLILLVVFIPVLQLPASTAYFAIIAVKACVPLFGTVVFYRMVNIFSLYLERMAKKSRSTLDDQLVPLIRKVLKTFVVVIGTLFVLSNLNIDIVPLLTGLSIGGLAFALAAQDTIKNFFGSLMIFIDKPFQIGDWITSGDIDGNVEEVGFRSSRIRTFRNSMMYVPNGKLADSTIDNHGLRKYRRFYTQIALTYDTPPELIQLFVDGLKKVVEKHPDTRKDYYNIFLNDMATYSLNIMFYIFFEVPDWTEELRARHEVLLEILKLGKKLGVNFAFPTQTLHMENFPGKLSLSPTYSSPEEMRNSLDEFFGEPGKA